MNGLGMYVSLNMWEGDLTTAIFIFNTNFDSFHL